MKLKLFTDLIGALGKVADGPKAIVNLLAAERETIRQAVNGIYCLVDATLNNENL